MTKMVNFMYILPQFRKTIGFKKKTPRPRVVKPLARVTQLAAPGPGWAASRTLLQLSCPGHLILPQVTGRRRWTVCGSGAAAQVHAFRGLILYSKLLFPSPHPLFSPSEFLTFRIRLHSLKASITNRFRILKHMYKNRVHKVHWGCWWKGGKTPIKLEYSSGQSLGWSEELGKCWEQLFKWRWGESFWKSYT